MVNPLCATDGHTWLTHGTDAHPLWRCRDCGLIVKHKP